MSIENFSTKGQVYLKDERQQSEVKKEQNKRPDEAQSASRVDICLH